MYERRVAMTITELIEFAEKFGLLDDDAQEVLQFANNYEHFDIKRGVCGMCANRKTEYCPFPHQSGLHFPICLTFAAKKI